jgi:excisionase family DNA binding protein
MTMTHEIATTHSHTNGYGTIADHPTFRRGKPRADLTVAEVAMELRCSKAHVYNVIAGKVDGVRALPAISMGRRKLVRRTALEQWIETNATAAQRC